MTNQPLVPQIPGYRDVTLISSGSTSLVFRAVQTRLSRTVAIKVLLVDGDAATQLQYQRELETTVLLSSQPHIVGIIDTGTTAADNPYIVMEYCPGGSYGQILKQRGPLPVDEVVDVGMKIAEALQAAHDVGVLHRDVKPSNILRSAFGPALADFGIARAAHQLSGTDSLDRLTPYHASPEAMRKDSQTAASDLYSLASTMWHLLAGRPPFADADAGTGAQGFEGLLRRVLTDPPPPVPRPDVPEWLQRELTRALAKDPRQRHPSAYTFAETLRYNAYRSFPDSTPQAPPVAPPAAPRSGAPQFGAAQSIASQSIASQPIAPQSIASQPIAAQPIAPQPIAAQPIAPQSGAPYGPAGTGSPTAPSRPSAPVTAPREAFRWPQAAPTRREDAAPQPPAPVLDPAAAQAADESTVIWGTQPPAESGEGGMAGAGSAAPDAHRDRPVGDDEATTAGPAQASPSLPPVRQVQPPVSAPPAPWYAAGPTSAPPAAPLSGPPLSGPPLSGPPLSGPPLSGPPLSGPPLSGPPLSGPPLSGPPLSGPPLSGPPLSGPPLSGPPLMTQPLSGPPFPTPPASGPPTSQPPFPAPPFAAPPFAAPPLSSSPPARPVPDPWSGGRPQPQRRWRLIAIAAVSVLVLIVAIGVVVGLRNGSPGTHNAANSPSPAATRTAGITAQGAPTNVKLIDDHTAITVTWTDPSGGTAPVAVLGAPKGTLPHLLLQLEPGTTTYTQQGVNAAVDYCYIVEMIYSAAGTMFATSPQVCTHRLG